MNLRIISDLKEVNMFFFFKFVILILQMDL